MKPRPQPFTVGQRIRLVQMHDDPAPIPDGATGTVTRIELLWDNVWQVSVDWDAPHATRSLSLVIPPDQAEPL